MPSNNICKTAFICIVVLLVSFLARSQSFMASRMVMSDARMSDPRHHDKWYSEERLELFVGVNFLSFFVEGQYNIPDATGGGFSKKKFTKQIPTKTSYAASMGYSYPLAKYGEKSTLSLTVNVFATQIESQDIKIPLNAFDTMEKAAIFGVGLPLSLDYKVGAHSNYDRAYPFMYSFGVGINPMYYISGGGYIDLTVDDGYKFAPFVKGEIGYYWGVAWKLRATCTFINTLNRYDEDRIGEPDVKTISNAMKYSGRFSTSPIFTVGLCINPFAFTWEKYKD